MLVVIGLGMFAYHMFSTQYLFLGAYEHQAVHLAFILSLLFLNEARRAKTTWAFAYQLGLAALGLAATAYVFLNITHLEEAFGYPEPRDVVVGVVLVLLVVEATRAAWGWTLPIVTAVFVLYFVFGHLLQGQLHHREFALDYIISYLSIGLSGIFGTFLAISANQVFLFVVFGALLGVIKVNDFFFEAGKIAGKVFQGGPGPDRGRLQRARRHGFRRRGGQRRDHRRLHHPVHEAGRLQARIRGSDRGHRVHRRAADAAGHGRRRVPDGLLPRRGLRRRDARGNPAGDPVLLGRDARRAVPRGPQRHPSADRSDRLPPAGAQAAVVRDSAGAC